MSEAISGTTAAAIPRIAALTRATILAWQKGQKTSAASPMISFRWPKLGYLRAFARIASLLACGVSLLTVYYLQPIAAKVYNDLCASQGMTYPGGESVQTLGILMLLIAVPILLARSNLLVFINLYISLMTVLLANALRSTAGNTPYECFTIMGTYEDRTSGLENFVWSFLAVCLFSNLLLLIDLGIWVGRKLVTLWATSQSQGRLSWLRQPTDLPDGRRQ
jgi:hypothetical protein